MKLETERLILREHKNFKGRWWDTFMYAVIVDEWELHKQNNPVRWNELKD